MSEVRKFICLGRMDQRSRAGGGDWVALSDYDAAQVALAALREELASANQCALNYSDQAVSQQQRLTDAERRNSEHESMLRHFASCADVRQVGTSAMGYVAALIKPEGVSHDD